MDFDWTPEQRDLYQRCLDFSQRELNHQVSTRDSAHQFGHDEWRKCGAFGLLGGPIPVEYGGLGLDCSSTAFAFEAFGKGCSDGGLGLSAGAHVFACAVPVSHFASVDAKAKYLPSLASGEKIGANAISESGAGSDAFALKCRAEKVDGGYRITGEKIFVTNGPVADVLLVYASTNLKHGLLGISALLVDAKSVGVTIGTPFRKVGLTTSPMCSVYFDGCLVPESSRVGDEGKGAAVFNASMAWERTCLFAFWLGVMERQLEQVIDFASTRTQFGAPIGANQAVSHRIADMKVRLESARLLLYRACWDNDRGASSPLHISLAKLALSEAAVQSSLDAIQLFGGQGVLCETGIERYLRDSLAGTIYSGTSEMHRELIARDLGLPVNYWKTHGGRNRE